MYKRGVVKLIQAIKADTKAWKLTKSLADYTKVEQGKTLGQLAKSIEAKTVSNTASNGTSNGSDEGSSKSNTTPTKPRGGGFKFKRETKDQKSMHDFFKPKVKDESVVVDDDSDMEEDCEEKLVIDDVSNTDVDARDSHEENLVIKKEEKSFNIDAEKSTNRIVEKSSDGLVEKSSNGLAEKSANHKTKKVDLFGDDEEDLEDKAEDREVKDNTSAAKLRNYDKLLNNNSNQNELYDKLEAKISQLSQVRFFSHVTVLTYLWCFDNERFKVQLFESIQN